MMPKKFYRSKTFWFNLLALGVAIAGPLGFAGFEAAPEVAPIAAGAVAAVNLVLRLLTSRPVKL